jgi:ribosomal protein S18 acetylase RimI-like enzyme
MNKLVIRDMQEDDIPAILKIEQSSFSTPWSTLNFLNEIYNKYAFSKVTVYEGNVIGYICADYLLHAAQKFYKLFGFKVETIRKKYYGNPDEDALRMMGRL